MSSATREYKSDSNFCGKFHYEKSVNMYYAHWSKSCSNGIRCFLFVLHFFHIFPTCHGRLFSAHYVMLNYNQITAILCHLQILTILESTSLLICIIQGLYSFSTTKTIFLYKNLRWYTIIGNSKENQILFFSKILESYTAVCCSFAIPFI